MPSFEHFYVSPQEPPPNYDGVIDNEMEAAAGCKYYP